MAAKSYLRERDEHRGIVAVGRRLMLAALAGLAVAANLQAAFGAELCVGWAAVSITPPAAGMPFQAPQRPPYRGAYSEGVHDPLYAKAIVFELAGQKAAVVACDLTSIPIGIIREARNMIDAGTGLPGENVMICATHTHTGPQIRPRFLQNVDPPARQMAEQYIAELPGRIAESVAMAEKALVPAKARAGIASVEGLSFNRRFVMKDGTVISNPGKDDPKKLHDIVRPAGPIDPAVSVVCFESADPGHLAVLVNFAMHLDTTGGLAFSADYAYALAKILADAKGQDLLTVFTIGAAGNINHYDLLDPLRYHRTKSNQEAARIGTVVAARVLEAWPKLEPQAVQSLKVHRETVKLAMTQEKGAQLAEQFGNQPSFFDGEVEVTEEDGQWRFDAEVQVIALGNELAFVGIPGEPFVELGLAIKIASPYRVTIVQGLANGSIGYIPDRKAHAQGGYGASFNTTRCSPGSGEVLVEAATKLLVELRDSKPTP